MEGKLLERTDDSIKIDLEGMPVTFFMDEVESIDGQKPIVPEKAAVAERRAAPESAAVQPQAGMPGAPEAAAPATDASAGGAVEDSAKGWDLWYREARDFLQHVDLLLLKARIVNREIDAAMEDMLSKRSIASNTNADRIQGVFTEKINRADREIGALLPELYSLQPPADLRDYYAKIVKLFEDSRSLCAAMTQLSGPETESIRRSMSTTLDDCVLALEAEYKKHGAPQEAIGAAGKALTAYGKTLKLR
ncbi:MAG: hypothetical protein ACM3L6_03960 [Deltaproteobacteria bacterium]